MLPFALSRSDSFRSVQGGRSRFSRCCNLIIDLQFRLPGWNLGQAINAVTGTRLLSFVFSLPGTILLLSLSFTQLPQPLLGGYCAVARIPPLTHR